MKKLILVALVLSILQPTLPAHATVTLTDLDDDDPSLTAIEALYDSDVIDGYDDGTFQSTSTINRAEFLKIVVASAVDEPSGSDCFSDVGDEWFAKYVCTAKEKGWINGYADGTFLGQKHSPLLCWLRQN